MLFCKEVKQNKMNHLITNFQQTRKANNNAYPFPLREEQEGFRMEDLRVRVPQEISCYYMRMDVILSKQSFKYSLN